LEDLYLPFKPKKQSRSSLARQQGLEPLADDIFNGVSPDVDLATRATDFVRVDKGLTSVDEVIKGVGDLIAERLGENDELRSTLRKIMWNEGKLASVAIEKTPAVANESEVADKSPTKESKSGEVEADKVKPVADAESNEKIQTQTQAQMPKAVDTPVGDVTADQSTPAASVTEQVKETEPATSAPNDSPTEEPAVANAGSSSNESSSNEQTKKAVDASVAPT
jgi:uncharacterized protein